MAKLEWECMLLKIRKKINKLQSQAVECIFHKSINFTNSDSWVAGRDEVGRVGLGGGDA